MAELRTELSQELSPRVTTGMTLKKVALILRKEVIS